MVNLILRVVRRSRAEWSRYAEKRRLAPLHAPDPANLDIDAHLAAAAEWLTRAQDAGNDRGVTHGVKFGSDFDASYPETTGYVCQTLVILAEKMGKSGLARRPMEMGRWEADIQLTENAVMGGRLNPNPTPAVFNTVMVLLGWSALIRTTGDERIKEAARRAAEWLVNMQEPDGNWIRGNSKYANTKATVYNVKAAWGLCEVGLAPGRDDYVEAAIKNAEYCVRRQEPNGWYRDCCLSDPLRPLLHTIAYAMQGLLEIGKLTGRKDFVAAAQRTANSEVAILDEDGYLPGRQDSSFKGTVGWCCLTGSAQTSIVCSELYALTGLAKYEEAARRLNCYLMARHDIQNPTCGFVVGCPARGWSMGGTAL